MTAWDESLRARLAALADALAPADGRMPAASAVGVHTAGLDRVLGVRPDLDAPLRRAVTTGPTEPPADTLARLRRDDEPAWRALTTCVTGAYYMTPAVRRLLGYRGQEGVVVTSDDFVGWVSAGLLDPVLERGPVHRPDPRPTRGHA